jgi:hypothetical protein
MNTFNLFYAAYFRYLAAVNCRLTVNWRLTANWRLSTSSSRLTPNALGLLPISHSFLWGFFLS